MLEYLILVAKSCRGGLFEHVLRTMNALIFQFPGSHDVKKELKDAKEELEVLKSNKSDIEKNPDTSKHGKKHTKCKTCAKVFTKNSDLEVHIEIEHTELKKFECAEWRLKKHARIHTTNKLDLRYCHYFNNEKICPFAKLGCMFMHESAPNL